MVATHFLSLTFLWMSVVPNYYERLRTKQGCDDDTYKAAYERTVQDIRDNLNVDTRTSLWEEEQARLAYEMIQCASSRTLLDQALSRGSMVCRMYSPHVTPWAEALITHPLSCSNKAHAEWKGEWTPEQDAAHAKFMEDGGHMFKSRHITSEQQFVHLLRYNCTFNAFAVLGMDRETLDPDAIMAAKAQTEMKEWRETALGSLSAQSMEDYNSCVTFATQCLLSPHASEYVHALEKGFLTEVNPHTHMVYNIPVTRSNLQRLLDIGASHGPVAKKQKTSM